MFGYVTKKEAKQHGFTHNGSYYGIPLWIGGDEECPMIASKFTLLDPVMDLFFHIEGFINTVILGKENSFQFTIKEEI